jgi:WXXGXW repeat (2 copies)
MKLRSFIFAGFLFLTLSSASFAQVGISVNFAPPPLPVVVQPPCPVEGYIWTPSYWAWGGADYYLVPGAWVAPPTIGLLWTPPWWGWNNGVYAFNEGYWGPTVGFYGGINYGFGYFGDGYWGGRWEGDRFLYNTAVTRVNTTVIHNTYVDKTVVNKQATATRASFNGPNGVKAQPTTEQKAAAENAKKTPPTSEQLARQEAASKDKNLQASVNKGHPSTGAIKSFNQTHPTGKGAEGVGAGATGAGAGKAESKIGTASEKAGFGPGTANAGEHANKHATENFHGNKQNFEGTRGKAHTSKATGYTGAAHTQHGMMQGPPRRLQNQMGPYHAQGGGSTRGQPQQGKKKPNQGPPPY